MTVAPSLLEQVGRAQAILRSVHEFDNAEVLPIVQTLISVTDRERPFVAAHYRAVALVRTLLGIAHAAHYQAVAMSARALFELAVDLRLVEHIPDAIAKTYAYSASERLHVARKKVELSDAGKISDAADIERNFVSNEGAAIDAECQKWFGSTRRPKHWSGLPLADRVKKLGSPYEECYLVEYAQLSWDVHPGIAGVLGLDVNAYPAKCGVAFFIATRWYADVIRAVARELKIDQAVEKLNAKIDLATLLPFTESSAEAQRLADAFLS